MKNLFAVVVGLLASAFAGPVSADPAVDALFDRSHVHDVQISMKESDWSTLRARYLESSNYDAVVTIDGETVLNSSLRSRGSGTRNGVKPGLRVDFTRSVKTQRFRGFKVLVLDNMYNDPSFIREQLAFDVFRESGIRVPRESFARVTVNGQYWGLYAIVEPIDQIFVERHVDGGQGNLFEYNVPSGNTPDALPGWDFTLSRGETVDAYIPSPFEPKTNEDDLDGSGLLRLIRTVANEPDATFVSEISKFIDPHVLLTYYAIEVATAEVDGLTSFFGVNNFYLYQLQGTERFLFIPWDHDFNFTSATHPIYHGTLRNRLIRRLLENPEMNAFYLETLQSVVDRFVNPSWMFSRVDAMVAQIRSAVLEDRKRRGGADNPSTTEPFDEAVAQIRAVIEGRGPSIDAQLTGRRRRPVTR